MLNTIIVDNEECSQNLTHLLHTHCPEVKILHVCYSCQVADEAIKKWRPSLIFYNLELPDIASYNLASLFDTDTYYIVFTSRSDQYAVKALHLGAIDYLIKPIDAKELKRAVQKVIHHRQHLFSQQVEQLLHKMNHSNGNGHSIAMPTMEGLQMIKTDQIISCQSDSNYTVLMLKDKQRIIVSRTLKEIEELLEPFSFIRVHHSHLVNINEIHKYVKGEGGYLIMSNGATIDVSRSKKETLIKKLLHKGQ